MPRRFAPLLVVVAALVSETTCLGQLGTIHDARTARIAVEIEQLSHALHSYHNKCQAFPPCLAETDFAAKKVRFLRHLAQAFPNSNYGNDVAAFDALNAKVQTEWKYQAVRRSGELAPLDLSQLDPAEALIFWLNGFPTPLDSATKQPLIAAKFISFHRDPSDPLKYAPLDAATITKERHFLYYDFDRERLTDHDDDGWPEYAMGKKSSGGLFSAFTQPQVESFPPFVYFDGATYAAITNRKQFGQCRYPREAKSAAAWGSVGPYLASFSPETGAATWHRPDKFQLVCAGLDYKFGPVGTVDKLPPSRCVEWGEKAIRCFTADDDFTKPHELDPAELDNLSNLAVRPIGQAIGEPIKK